MRSSQYSNAFKTVAILLQMVFVVVVIVAFSLIVNLYEGRIPDFSDIGNHSFFESSYYAEKITEELQDLTMYLHLCDMDKRSEQGNEKYKQYKLKYDNGDSNLYYWLSKNDKIYTNMPKEYTRNEAIAYAEEMGSYFYYDDTAVIFTGTIKHTYRNMDIDILRFFRQGTRDGGLIIAVDVSLPKEDTIAEAANVFDTYFPWVEFGLFAAIISCMSFILCMIYLTLAAGRNGENDDIHLHRIDYLPTEIHFVAIFFFLTGLIAFYAKLNGKNWGISSSLVLNGTLVFLSDTVLLTLYLSIVRKIKAEIFTSCSFISYITRTLKEAMHRQDITRRAMIQLAACVLLELFFMWEAFVNKHIFAIFGIILIFVAFPVKFLQQAIQRKKILEGVHEISRGQLSCKFDTDEFDGDYREIAEEINGIGEGLMKAVEGNLKSERLKTELVTNVSHDIKTPLTSIINYISLIKLEGTWNENVENYVSVLEKKSQRLKQLTEDLLEVSQITSGNIMLDMQPINMVELICQTGGEFNEIFEDVGLTVVTRLPKEPVMILADGSRVWRVVQNLYNNVAKYALKDTRVFVELKVTDGIAEFSIKDISAQGIHKTPQDLSERFVRGDESRGTEGSGLGLSIARNLTTLMGGTFEIEIDGDLFTASIAFPVLNP